MLKTWAPIQKNWPNWEIVIAGPDEVGQVKKMQELTVELNLDRVIWMGPIYGREKHQLYKDSDIFVLPTHSENFGLVVAEALGHGIPVLTTRNAPWQGLVSNNCGWWIDLLPEALAAALEEAMSLSDAERQAMGSRGVAWIRRDFAPVAVAQQMHEVYTWVLGGGSPPACVVTD